ncbi:MAG: DUF1501 domain-containing protein [Planctomycetes bacterium]|nr:DUF1501 domain-containing protein [Planctomycetota bacterium]
MISLLTKSLSKSVRRRDALKLAGLSALAPSVMSFASSAVAETATAKNCIYIFLCGGPSQLEMWDPKPDAPDGIRGPFKSIETSVPGMHIGELLPSVAKHAEKLAIIRSMTHESNVHDIGILYTLLADSKPPTNVAYPPTRGDHPGLGAILRSLLGEQTELPSWVTVPRAFTTGARFYKGQSGGFLGPAYDPFFLDEEKTDSLGDKTFQPPSLQLRGELSQTRLSHRRDLLEDLNEQVAFDVAAVKQSEQYYDKAYSMLSTAGASQAFDVGREPNVLRDRYGRNEYGQSFLLARRLVESGVRMVNVFWTLFGKDGCQFNLWDNHGSDKEVCGGFNRGVDMLTAPYCCPAFDRAFAALLEDLSERGMLDDTLVVVAGEFGRTPKINKNTGRDHWAPCYSTVLAGGGVQGGQVYGASDAQAAYVKDSPVRPEDLGATILHAFGLSPESPIYDVANRPVRASKGRPVTTLFS